MPTITVNGVRLAYDDVGAGPALVYVHGSWTDRGGADLAVPLLAEGHRVVAYDRRGHSESERPPHQADLEDHASDLATLLESLDAAPACLLGISFGSVVCLTLALRRPELVAGLCLHEPPPFNLDDPEMQPMLAGLLDQASPLIAVIERGDHAAAARAFTDTVLGPDVWEALPGSRRQAMTGNAPTFVDDLAAVRDHRFDIDELARLPVPVLLTAGGHSGPMFPRVAAALAARLTTARRHTFEDAGHLPHMTHPEEYAAVVADFVASTAATAT